MAHFANIDSNNIVTRVVVVPDEQENQGQEYLNSLGLEGTWIQTSYNNNFRKVFAGVGFEYLPEYDAFQPSQTFETWVFDYDLWQWKPPFDKPDDGKIYGWNAGTQNWKELPSPFEIEEGGE
jgi:hypothetical protein